MMMKICGVLFRFSYKHFYIFCVWKYCNLPLKIHYLKYNRKKSLVERTRIGGWAASKLLLKSGGGLFMSTVVIFNEIVLSSASKYKSMKYSWQKIQAPFRRPSMVEALMISSISGMLLFPFPFSIILTRKNFVKLISRKKCFKKSDFFFQVQQQQHCVMETPQLLLNTMSASLAVLSTCYIKFYSACGVWIL